MIIVLTPVSFFVAKFISSHSFQMFRAQSDARGRQTALIEEMIGNQKVVQAFGYEIVLPNVLLRSMKNSVMPARRLFFTAA